MAVNLRLTLAFVLPLSLPLAALVAGRPRALPPADFTFVLPKENTTLDPAFATSVSDGWLVQGVFEGLLRFDPETLRIQPAVARTFEVSSDGLRYRFELATDRKWSDGVAVTARDFEFGWRRLLDPRTAAANAGLLAPIRNAKRVLDGELATSELGARAEDEHRFVVELEAPCPHFPQLVAHFAAMPAREDLVSRDGEAAYLPGRLVCNGPYRPTLRRVRDRLRLERNPHHPTAHEIAFGTIDALAIESKATALNLFLEGSVDWVNALPTIAIPRLRERPELRFSTLLATNFLRMNVTRGALSDERVRRAIDYAIDRAELCAYVYRSGERPARTLVCPGLPNYPLAADAPDRDRPDEARALLAAAGFEGGRSFPELELLHAADEAARPVAESIAAALERALGIRVRPVPQEFKVFLDSQRSLRYDLCLGNWIGDYPDPSTFLDIFRGGSPNNRTGWRDPEYDRLLAVAGAELDPTRRAATLRDAESRLLTTGPIAPIAWRSQANLVAADIEGFTPNPLDLHPLERLRRRAR